MTHERRAWPARAIAALLLAMIVAATGWPVPAQAQDGDTNSVSESLPAAQPTAEVHPGMSPRERLAEPPLSDPPTQLELGHHEYWMSCMVCHGDRGQGLTEEWRSVLDPADMNCWQSKCHAPNHPPEGFQIPRQAPMIIGPSALTGYETATDLYEYLRVEMPWAFPGLFEDEVYWQLTAYLAEVNGIDAGPGPLGPDNGDDILLLSGVMQTHHPAFTAEKVAVGVVVGLLVCATLLREWLHASKKTAASRP